MGNPSRDRPKLREEALISSQDEEIYGADPASLNENVDDVVDFADPVASHTRLSESPGTKRVMAMIDGKKTDPVEASPVQISVKPLQRPSSAGDEACAPPRYQMVAATLRSAQVQYPIVPRPQLKRNQSIETADPEIHDFVHSEMPNTDAGKLTTQGTQRSATRENHTTSDPGHHKRSLQHDNSDGSMQIQLLPPEADVRPGIQDLTNVKQSKVTGFKFAPANLAQNKPPSRADKRSAESSRPLGLSEQSAQTEDVLKIESANETRSPQPDTILPSIEDENIAEDKTLVEQQREPVARRVSVRPNPTAHAQIQPSTPAADRQIPVLGARIVKRLTSNVRARRTPQQYQLRPTAAVSQPSEEDLFFLLMHRNRRAKGRELELEASHKKLRAEIQSLHEQGRTYHQQLTAANIRTQSQGADIVSYKSEIENFKSRFTKFKAYAKDLAKDHEDIGAAMKKIGITTDRLMRDKADVNRSLKSLWNMSDSATELLADIRPKISAVAREAGPLKQALHMADEKLHITDSCLQHERLRNNRIETQILNAQHRQERFSFSSMQEYRKAAAYLDDLCQTILHLGKVVVKGQQPKDTPGVLQCLDLLQALTQKHDTGSTILAQAKTAIVDISEKLLSYHTTVEEAAKAAASNGDRLGKDVLAQIATSLGGIGPSIGTEVNFATLRERIAGLQRALFLSNQTINLAFDGKSNSEQREKELSEQVDKLIQHVAEASKQQRLTVDTSAPPNSGPDMNMILTKYMQANLNYNEAQSKMNQKVEEVHQRSLEVLALKERLKTLQVDLDASQSSLIKLEGRHHNLQGQADAAVEANLYLKKQLKQLDEISIRAAEVPSLVERLAAKDLELNGLRTEAARIPGLVQDLQQKDTEIDHLQLEASKVSNLDRKLAASDAELVNLQEMTSAMSELEKSLASKEAELKELRPKATHFDGVASKNLVYQSEIHIYKETIQKLEQRLGSVQQDVAEIMQLRRDNKMLKAEAENVERLVQSLEGDVNQLRDSEQQVERLKQEIMTMKLNQGDQDQLKKDLETQKDVHAKHIADLDSLQSKFENAQAVASQVPTLRAEVQELSEKCGNLNQQLGEAAKAADRYQNLGKIVEQKDEEITSLKTKLEKAENAVSRASALQEESQQKTGQLAALQEQIRKIQVDSRTMTLHEPERNDTNEERHSIQQTVLEFPGINEQANETEDSIATLQSTTHFATTWPDKPQRRKADRNAASRTRHASLRLNDAEWADTRNCRQLLQKITSNVDETPQIPDSQPQADMRDVLATSLPLSDIESLSSAVPLAASAQGRRREVPDSRSPSSSYGGDSMLLEDFEAIEGMNKETQLESLVQNPETSCSQRQSKKPPSYGHASSRTIVAKGGIASSHRRLRSALSFQVIQETQSQEQSPSSPIVMPSSSPAGLAKHLPNSAIKRPRLDPIEATPSVQTSSKRLKQKPANLEVRKTPERPMSSSTQITEPESVSVNRVSLPSGSRKGIVIGANAPAPSKAKGSRKQSRKGSKADSYAARFCRE